MNFCWGDVFSNTDVDALFARYRDTMAALERDFPNVTFIHVTVPLTTEPGLFTELKTWVKTLLGRRDVFGQRANVTRERLNALIRGEYAGRHLFDLAAIESTKPDGTRVSGRYDNQGYFALYDGYASDSGLPQRGWCQDRGDSLSRGDRAGLAEVDTAGDDSAHMPRRLMSSPRLGSMVITTMWCVARPPTATHRKVGPKGR